MAASTAAIIGTGAAIFAACLLLYATLTSGKDAKRDRTKIRAEIGDVRAEIGDVRTEVDDGFKAAATDRTELRTEMGAVRTDMKKGFDDIKEILSGAQAMGHAASPPKEGSSDELIMVPDPSSTDLHSLPRAVGRRIPRRMPKLLLSTDIKAALADTGSKPASGQRRK